MDTSKVILFDNKGVEHEGLLIVCPDCGYSSFHLFVVEDVSPVSGMVKHINHVQCTHCSTFFCKHGCCDEDMPTEFGSAFAKALRSFARGDGLKERVAMARVPRQAVKKPSKAKRKKGDKQ